jgi:8-oxo-dGTP diphosphatase
MADYFKNKKLPRVTVDAFVTDRRGRVLLVRRGRPPFKGNWALPGGFCEYGETTEACCARETLEETGVTVRVGKLLGVYSDPKRDPRWHTVTVLYAATPVRGKAKGSDDAAEARWFAKRELGALDYAFDHGQIIRRRTAQRPAKGRARRARRGASRG